MTRFDGASSMGTSEMWRWACAVSLAMSCGGSATNNTENNGAPNANAEPMEALDGRTTADFPCEPRADSTSNRWCRLAAGRAHACALTEQGDLHCWGSNEFGQVGTGNLETPQGPTQIGESGQWRSVTTGHSHTCAVDFEGTIWCWGRNEDGIFQFPGRPFNANPTPAVFIRSSGGPYLEVAAGHHHTCALRDDTTLTCWGYNEYGTTSYDPGTGIYSMEQAVPWVRYNVGLEPPRMVAAGHEHTCMLVDDKTYCWGRPDLPWLWPYDCTGICHEPREREAMRAVGDLRSGAEHVCGLEAAGTLWCFGSNADHQIGGDEALLADPRATAEDVAFFATGFAHTCWGNADGVVRCIGAWEPSGPSEAEPTSVAGSFLTLAAGDHFTCGVAIDGQLYCWGAGEEGQLGLDVSGGNMPTPTGAPQLAE